MPSSVDHPRPIFFVRLADPRSLPTRAALERELQRWIIRQLSGWLQLSVLERLREGRVCWDSELVASARVGDRSARVQLLAVHCEDRPGPRRPGLWAALSVAHALAELLGGQVVDARQSAALFGPRAWTRPPADGRVHAAHHLALPRSTGYARTSWVTSAGMAHFGLPDLELDGLSARARERGAALMLGAAQHMIDAGWRAPQLESGEGELILELGELHWALGGDAHSRPLSSGRGWTRVKLEPSAARSWPRLLRLRPPAGSRTWRSASAWVDAAWRDLFGRAAGHSSIQSAHRKSSHFLFAPSEGVDY